MATETLNFLIVKQDNFQIVRDRIAEILTTEISNQKALALLVPTDPAPWDIKIFTERTNPWEAFLNQDDVVTPIVNIWYDNSGYPKNKGGVVDRQSSETVYNIDCIGFGVAEDDGSGGHNPGDELAALESERAVVLVRNILMSNINVDLQLQGLVGDRWTESIVSFQPRIDNSAIQKIAATRISFKVKFNEFAPQQTTEVLEVVEVTVKRLEDGEVVMITEYDYT